MYTLLKKRSILLLMRYTSYARTYKKKYVRVKYIKNTSKKIKIYCLLKSLTYQLHDMYYTRWCIDKMSNTTSYVRMTLNTRSKNSLNL